MITSGEYSKYATIPSLIGYNGVAIISTSGWFGTKAYGSVGGLTVSFNSSTGQITITSSSDGIGAYNTTSPASYVAWKKN